MDMTRIKIEAEILKWDRRRAEAVRLHNHCAHDEPEMRDILWRWVKVYEGFIGSLRECLAVHIANTMLSVDGERKGKDERN
jgi:hypothetical protein